MVKRIAQVLAVLVVMLLVGCALSPWTKSNAIVSNKEEVDFPSVGSLNTEGLGDTLVSKGYKSTTPSLHIIERWEYKSRSTSIPEHWINSGTTSTETVIWANSATGEKYTCFLLATQWADHWNNDPLAELRNEDRAGNAYFCKTGDGIFQDLWQLRGLRSSWQPFNVRYEEVDVVDVTKPSYIQEFIYNGRVDNSLKFIYREFSGDYLRPSFTQEVQYDLNLSSEIGFKNLKLEVIKATNTEITYKLISNF